MIEYAQRLTHRQRNVLAGDTHPSVGARLFSGALAGGAQALGVETGIAVGAPADLVALDVDDPALVGRSGDAARTSVVQGNSVSVRVDLRGRRRLYTNQHQVPRYLALYHLTLPP